MEDDVRVVTIEDITKATEEDSTLYLLLKDIYSGKLSDSVKDRPYGKVFVELSSYKGLILKGGHIMIPVKLMEQALALGHQSYGLGTSKTTKYLREWV